MLFSSVFHFPGFHCVLFTSDLKSKFGCVSQSFKGLKVLCLQFFFLFSYLWIFPEFNSWAFLFSFLYAFPESTMTHGFDFRFHVDGSPFYRTSSIYNLVRFQKVGLSLCAKWHLKWVTANTLGWNKEQGRVDYVFLLLWLTALFES